MYPESKSGIYIFLSIVYCNPFLKQPHYSTRSTSSPNWLLLGFGADRNWIDLGKYTKELNDQTGTEEEGEENGEEIESLQLCCSDDEEGRDSVIKLTHVYPSVVANFEHTKKKQDAILLFNNNRMLLATQRKNSSYFHGGIEDNHRALISMMFLVQDPIFTL